MKYVQNTYLSEDTWNGNFLIGFEIFITDKQGSEKTHMIPIVTGTVVSVIVITIVFVIVITVWKRRQRYCAMFHWESLLNIDLKTILCILCMIKGIVMRPLLLFLSMLLFNCTICFSVTFYCNVFKKIIV